jgi:hypothetical protein
MAACVAERTPSDPGCSRDRDDVLPPVAPCTTVPNVPGNVSFPDFTDYFCEADT